MANLSGPSHAGDPQTFERLPVACRWAPVMDIFEPEIAARKNSNPVGNVKAEDVVDISFKLGRADSALIKQIAEAFRWKSEEINSYLSSVGNPTFLSEAQWRGVFNVMAHSPSESIVNAHVPGEPIRTSVDVGDRYAQYLDISVANNRITLTCDWHVWAEDVATRILGNPSHANSLASQGAQFVWSDMNLPWFAQPSLYDRSNG